MIMTQANNNKPERIKASRKYRICPTIPSHLEKVTLILFLLICGTDSLVNTQYVREKNIIRDLNHCRSIRDVDTLIRQRLILELDSSENGILHKKESDDASAPVSSSERGTVNDDLSSRMLYSVPRVSAKALRKVARLLKSLPDPMHKRYERMTNEEKENIEAERRLAKILLPILLKPAAEAAIIKQNKADRIYMRDTGEKPLSKSDSNQYDVALGLDAASIVDTLYSLALITRKKAVRNDKSFKELGKRLILAASENDLLLDYIGANGLSEMVWSMAVMNLREHTAFVYSICNSLEERRNFLDQLSSHDLTNMIWSFARINCAHVGAMLSISRAFRKQITIEKPTSYDMCRTIWAFAHLVREIDSRSQGHLISTLESTYTVRNDLAVLRHEGRAMLYRLRRLVLKTEVIPTCQDRPENKGTAFVLHSGQIADIYWAWTVFGYRNDMELCSVLNKKLLSDNVISSCSVQSIARILSANRSMKVLFPEVIEKMGERFLHLAVSKNLRFFNSGILAQILNAVVELLPTQHRSLSLYFEATSLIMRTGHSAGSFFASCNGYNISMITWAVSVGRWFDASLIENLAIRMLDNDVLDTCSANSASKMLWSYTTLLSLDECIYSENFGMRYTQSKLFEQLGNILLTEKLTAVDASSAMWAIAKASFGSNVGVFDHLAEYLSHKNNFENVSVKQLSKALWACGKMIEFEDPIRAQLDGNVYTAPPYIISAVKFSQHLLARQDEINSKDISQIMWALARLKIQKPEIIDPLTSVAVDLAKTCSAQEASNLLWAFSKLNVNDDLVSITFTERICCPSILAQMNAQEAANILYAYAKLKFRNKRVFAEVSTVLIQHVDTATSQAIANALWAHEQLDLPPPNELFDKWAREKLGIISIGDSYGYVVDAETDPSSD